MIRLFFCVTFCTARRRKILANTRAHRAFIDYAKRGLDHNMAVGRYVLMPDHIYFFVGDDHEFDLGMWVRGLNVLELPPSPAAEMERILPLRQRQLHRFCHWENYSPFRDADFLITRSAIPKVTPPNGIMFAKILFLRACSARQRICHFKVKLWRLSTPEDLPPVTSAATTCGIATYIG